MNMFDIIRESLASYPNQVLLARQGCLPGRRRGRGLATWRAVFAGLGGGEEKTLRSAKALVVGADCDGAWKIDVTSHTLGAYAMMRFQPGSQSLAA